MQQQRCQFCRRQIDVEKLVLHELYCERNCVRCELCGYMYDQTDKESHDEEFHKMETCPHCKQEFADLKTHDCKYIPTNCPYCLLDQPLIKFEEHQIQCGSRTEKCDSCNAYILLRNFQKHIQTCQQNKAIKEVEDFPTLKEAEIRKQNIQQKQDFQPKIPPKDTQPIREPYHQYERDRNLFKESKQQIQFQPQQQDLISFPERKEFAPSSNQRKQKEKIFNNKEEKMQEDQQFKSALEKQSKAPYESQGFTQVSFPNQFETNTFKSSATVKENYESYKAQLSGQIQSTNQNTEAPLKGYKESKGHIQYPNPYQLNNQQQVQQNRNYEQDKQSNLIKQNQQKNFQVSEIESNQFQRYGNQIPKNDPDQFRQPSHLQQKQQQEKLQQTTSYSSRFAKNNPELKQNDEQNFQYKLETQKQENSRQNQKNSFQPEYKLEQQNNMQKPKSDEYQNWHQRPHNDQKDYFKNYPKYEKYQGPSQQFEQEKQYSNLKQQNQEYNKPQRMQIDKKQYENIPKEALQKSGIVSQVYPQQPEGSKFFIPQSNIISNQPQQYANIRNPQALQEPKFIKISEIQQEELPMPNDSVIARRIQEEENLGMTQSKIQLHRSLYEQFEQSRPQRQELGKPKSPPKTSSQIPSHILEAFNYLSEDELKLQIAILEGYEREKQNRSQ